MSELKEQKEKKRKAIEALGIDPYPHSFEKKHDTSQLLEATTSLEAGEKKTEETFITAGRLMTMREMGKSVFFNLQDAKDQIQVYVKLPELEEKKKSLFNLLDIGDILGVTGFVFKTKKGEPTLYLKDFSLLTKSIETLPEKYHGISNIEEKYRKRYLDLIMSRESFKVFETRSHIITLVRDFLTSKGFLEVDTPILQPLYGGAQATPFVTQHKALDMKLYLRISPELYLKRLIVGGFEKVFEINKNFRNEGIDRSHNPEFMLLEWYEAYTDYYYQMEQFTELVNSVVQKIKGSLVVEYQGKKIDFTAPWKRITVYGGLIEYANIDAEKLSFEELVDIAKKEKIANIEATIKQNKKGLLVMKLFEHFVEDQLWNPTFVMDHPVETSPLTKLHRDNKNLVERFEPFMAGMEIGNSYSELNDPEDQRNRLKEQEGQRKLNEEFHPTDEDFIHAMEVGMPPTGGVGLGIERLVMILTDQASIRDVLLFPTMKSK